jgi:hypothetical protein
VAGAVANDFDIVRPDNSVVTDGTVCVGCRVAIKQSLKDRITALENQADQVGVTHQELADSTNNIRLAINTALANYYTKTQSDARFYPLTGNPSKFVTSTNVASFTAADTARAGALAAASITCYRPAPPGFLPRDRHDQQSHYVLLSTMAPPMPRRLLT